MTAEAEVRAITGVSQQSRIYISDEGWTNQVYVVEDGRFIVKFSRQANAASSFRREISVLELLKNGSWDVRFPKVRWTDASDRYVGFEGIVGRTLDSVGRDTIDAIPSRLYGKQLGSFLKQFHSLTLPDMPTITIEDEINRYQSKYNASQQVIKQHFTKSQQEKLKTLVYEVMPFETRRLGSDMVLCHGDLAYWNIIVGNDGQLGVIDFGAAGYYDRSKDFLCLDDDLLRERALIEYGADARLNQKITVRRAVLPLVDMADLFARGEIASGNEYVAVLKRNLLRVGDTD